MNKFHRKIFETINYEKMEEVFRRPILDFGDYGTPTDSPDGIFYHKDNGADILAIAHLDTVIEKQMHFKKIGDLLYSPVLDDRLGAYIITDILPRFGVHVDLLLTEGEEKGQSTAHYFETDKEYNWMFQFDRSGGDMVMYEYETIDLVNLMQQYHYSVGFGAFSDICYLSHLKCKGFNFGTGYHDNHSIKAFAILSQMVASVAKFIKFYHDHKEIKMPHDPKESGYGGASWGWGDDYYDLDHYSSDDYMHGSYPYTHADVSCGDDPRRYKRPSTRSTFCVECGTQLYFRIEEDWGLCTDCLRIDGKCRDCGHNLLFNDEIESGLCCNCARHYVPDEEDDKEVEFTFIGDNKDDEDETTPFSDD